MSSIRDATRDDAGAIARVHVASWRAAYDGLMPASVLAGLDEGVRADRWRSLLESRPRYAVLVVEADGCVVGFLSLGPVREESLPDPRLGEVTALYLDPEHCGRGLGRALIAAGRARLAMLGFGEAVLWVLETNGRARDFYAADGWRPDGATKMEQLHSAIVHEVRYRRSLR